MEFIITGATGFIGREVTQKTLAAGHKVCVVTRDVARAKQLFVGVPNISFIDLEGFLAGRTTVRYARAIHLAWADVQNYNNEKNALENNELQDRFLEALVNNGVEDITSAGTCLEYGMREGMCHEDMLVREALPTQYAQAKHQSYLKLVEMQKKNANLHVKWVRCFYTYGVGQRPNSLFSLVMKAIAEKQPEFNMSQGDQQRDYSHLSTLAHNIHAIAAQGAITGIINAGNGKPMSVLAFVEKLMQLKNHSMKLNKGYYPYSAYEPHAFWADVSKLQLVANAKFDDDIWI